MYTIYVLYIGMSHIQNRSVLASVEQDLPINMYWEILSDFSDRLNQINIDLGQLETHLGSLLSSQQASQQSISHPIYGSINTQATAIGIPQVVALIKNQLNQYNNISHAITLLHEEVSYIYIPNIY